MKLTHEEMCEAWGMLHREVITYQVNKRWNYCVSYQSVAAHIYDMNCSKVHDNWFREMEDLYGEDNSN
jgi:hypothetical protein